MIPMKKSAAGSLKKTAARQSLLNCGIMNIRISFVEVNIIKISIIITHQHHDLMLSMMMIMMMIMKIGRKVQLDL